MKSLDLVAQIRSGKDARAAQEELYLRVQNALLARLQRKIPERLRSRMDPEDVLHEAFLRALKSLDTFHAASENSFYGWVYAIAKNLIIDTGRRQSSLAIPIAKADGEPGLRESRIHSRRRGVSTELLERELVENLLGRLPGGEAEVIRLRFLQSLSFETIARRWKKSAGAVQRYYSRAMNRLRILARLERRSSRGTDG